ncbi:hypothetical protein [Psittacicella hinzii]|uniref:Uncharacterized protein n=1 Tax=Psittacicella hinzii TaxID=2028575 RepID=A0A3A1YNJ8_9GAMM|nr:hypothetical protein [Psittacicella hinzii]RIY38809.1 hypothetical protein CKF58_03260 [Psittacicella hinzii]
MSYRFYLYFLLTVAACVLFFYLGSPKINAKMWYYSLGYTVGEQGYWRLGKDYFFMYATTYVLSMVATFVSFVLWKGKSFKPLQLVVFFVWACIFSWLYNNFILYGHNLKQLWDIPYLSLINALVLVLINAGAYLSQPSSDTKFSEWRNITFLTVVCSAVMFAFQGNAVVALMMDSYPLLGIVMFLALGAILQVVATLVTTLYIKLLGARFEKSKYGKPKEDLAQTNATNEVVESDENDSSKADNTSSNLEEQSQTVVASAEKAA